MTAMGRAKAVVRPVRASAGARYVADEILLAHSTRLGAHRRSAELLHQMSMYDMPHPDERSSTVSALVDLFFRLVESLAVERFVEAGAKEASASVRAAAVTGVRETVAFEANPYTFRRFAGQVEDSGIRYEHKALSDAPGVVEFLVRLDERGRPIPDGQASLLGRSGYALGFERVEVEAVTLDSFFAAPTGVRTAVWMDVEGATSLVTRGATALLAETVVAIIEVEERAGWEGQEWLRADVVEAMKDLGLVPVARDRQSRFQFNIVFVREDLRHELSVTEALDAWRQRLRADRRARRER